MKSIKPLKKVAHSQVEQYVKTCVANRIIEHGPFKGMHYINESTGSAFYPKLLGTYEKEILPWIELLIAANFEHILNIGAAEGYYAVGMAMRTQAKITAFEAFKPELTTALAKENKVEDRIHIQSYCDIGRLKNALTQPQSTLILCDIEGSESILIDPTVVPELKEATLLIELHEFIIPGVGDLIRERFANTHHIEEVDAVPRTPEDFPYETPKFLFDPRYYFLEYMNENRPAEMSWLLLKPTASN